MKLASLVVGLLVCFSGSAAALPIVLTSDFIVDGLRTGFNGFEAAPDTASATAHVEGGISVARVAASGLLADTTCTGFSAPTCQAHEGTRSWYQSDTGYARITLSGGGDFQDVGMLTGAGYGSVGTSINYVALLDGIVQISGSVALPASGIQYLGFSGGGFDELRLTATHFSLSSSINNIQLDSIETFSVAPAAVPEPTSLLLLGTGGLGLVARARRRRALKKY